MSALPRINVPLDAPPAQRWQGLSAYTAPLQELITHYLDDVRELLAFRDQLEEYKRQFIAPEYLEEIRGITAFTPYSFNEVLLTNLYYDAIKYAYACTAFAVRTENGDMLHARNLDWWTNNSALARYSVIIDFQRNGQTQYTAVGWPGAAGVLSGISRAGFAISLNSVFSDEPPGMAEPVMLLIRRVLETAGDYREALRLLCTSPIACDCLLLVTGSRGEMNVVERTPRRFMLRRKYNNQLIVTNSYRALSQTKNSASPLSITSDGRYDRVSALLDQHTPQTPAECYAILDDPRVKMQITVQQMVFNTTRFETDARSVI